MLRLRMRFHAILRVSLVTALMSGLTLNTWESASAGVVYSNDFSVSAGPEWSNSTIASSNGEKFLGTSANGFGAGTDTLTLTGLASHSTVTVSFDVYIIQSWDGNGPNGGNTPGNPDGFAFAANAVTLLQTSFANYTAGNTQGFQSQAVTSGSFAPRTGEFDAGHLGFGTGDFGDATYRFSYTFSDSSSSLVLAFTSTQNQSPGDEGWGLDNVTVSTSGRAGVSSPEPSAVVLLTSGSIGLILAHCRRKRSASR